VDEIKKTAKITRHPWMKPKNAENHSSSMDETKKTAKIGFQPWRTNEKRRKLVFSRGGRTKNGENIISAAAENQK